MINREQIRAIFLAVLMVGSVLSVGIGGVAAQPTTEGEIAQPGLNDVQSTQESVDADGSSPVSDRSSPAADSEDGRVAQQLRKAGGVKEVIVTVERDIDRSAARAGDLSLDDLKADSEATLQPVAEKLQRLRGVQVKNQFWIGNALSLKVDLDRVEAEQIASIDGVRAVVPNVQFRKPQPVETESDRTFELSDNGTGPQYTYGLQQIDIPDFREKYGNLGGGVSVAVLDDGVSDPDNIHPDLEFNRTATVANGNVTEGTLGSPGSHGEHVAGTIAGDRKPAGPVPRYSVAPNASLTMVNVFEGGAALGDIIRGVEYAVEEDVDIVTMSLGLPSTTGLSVVDPVFEVVMQDAHAAGTSVVASAGNSGAGASGGPATSPGAEFSGYSVGATNSDGEVAGFSSGTTISPFQIELVRGGYPANYPYKYVKPDVSGPGVSILSTGPIGTIVSENPTYSTASGTSFAAPHITGALALLESVTPGDQAPRLLEAALAETAERPADADPEEGGRDIRYGTGIINVTAAADALAEGTLEISGTVTNTDGEPIAGATIETEAGALTSTDENGTYTLFTTQTPANLTVDAFGYESTTREVSQNGTQDFTLEDQVAVNLLEDQPAFAEFGSEFSVTADVRNLNTLTVELTDATNVSADELELTVAGTTQSFGEPIDLGGLDGVATITVDLTGSDYSEGQLIGLKHTFAGPGENLTVETGPTTLTEELDPASFELSNLQAPDTLVVGEALALSVDVTNTGQVAGTKDIQPILNTSVGLLTLPPEQITLAPGETTTYSTSAAGIGGFLGGGEVFLGGFRVADNIESSPFGTTVEGLNDLANAPIALQSQGPDFQVTELDAPVNAEPGAEITVDATIENVGSEAATRDVEFRFAGQTVATESVSLEPFGINSTADDATVSFTVTLPEESDVYTHGVFTENDSATASIGVGVSIPSVTVVSTNEFGPDTVTLLEQGLALNEQAAQVSYVPASEVDQAVIDETDVFVFHNLEGVAADVIPVVERDPTTTAVYLEQFADANAISQRSEVTGDPESSIADFEIGGPPVEFAVTQDHPLFDGVAEAGERFVVHDSEDSDFVFFEGASGETLAESGLQGSAPAGPTAAVDPDSGSVLLATIAPNTFEPLETFTDDAARVLANSVDVAQSNIVNDAVARTSIDAEFVGTVADAESVTVTASGVISDGEPVSGEEITFTIGGEPVATATVENGTAQATFDPATLDAAAGETLTVGVGELDVVRPAEVETVHEVRSLDEGYNLVSVPQAAELSAEGVGAINVWNASSGSYETVTQAEFDSPSDLHRGLYVSATDEDARLGFTFSQDVPVGGTADLEPGWNLVGSNFPIDSVVAGDTRTLDEDLIEVDPSELTVYSSDFDEILDANSTIEAYDAYWVFNGNAESAERAIISSSYDVGDRETVLGIQASAFEVNITDIETGDESLLENEAVLGSDEQVVAVTAEVTNDGGLDTQFIDLNVSGERVDRSAGVTLDTGESETVTLYYTVAQNDVPEIDLTVSSEDDSETQILSLDGGAFVVEDQALTLDDELVVNSVDFAGTAVIEVSSNGEVVGSETVESGVATDVRVPVNASAIEDGEVEVRLLNASDVEQTSETVTLLDQTIEVTNNAPEFVLADQDTVEVPVAIQNNALVEQTMTVNFTVAGTAVANETVTVDAGSNAGAVTFTADVSGLTAGDTVEHTASAAGSSDTRTLAIVEPDLTFSDQSVSDNGTVLVEDVTLGEDQFIAVTDTDLNVVGTTDPDGALNDETVTVDISDAAPGEYIAHIVSDVDDVAESPGLVNDQATIVDAAVTVNDVSRTFDEDEPAEVSAITVQTATVETATGAEFDVEIRAGGDGEVLGTAENLTGANTDVTVQLDDPITANTTIEAVLVGADGAAIEAPSDGALVPVSDAASVTIEVNELAANVELPDQERSSYNGSDSVLVEDVTGDAGQFVVITDSELNILGSTELEEDVASADFEVALEESVEPGEYRAHLTSDISLVGEDGVVTDAGVLVDGAITFTNQSYLDETATVVVDSTSVTDGLGGQTAYTVKLHEVTESGSVGDIVGSSGTLTGAEQDVVVELEPGETIQETGQYVAMLHFEESGSPIGESPVTDRATVTIEPTAADYQLSNLDPTAVTVETGETFSVSATIENTGDSAGNQTIELRVDGEVVATEANVEVAGGASTTVTFEELSLSEVGEFTHTVASANDSVSGDLTVVTEQVTFADQSPNDGQVLVENVTTTSADQQIVITDSEFNIVGTVDPSGIVVQKDLLVDIGDEAPGEYIAHIVTDASNADGGPDLVTDRATLFDAAVTVDDVTVSDTEQNLPVTVEEITVQTADLIDGAGDGTNFTVELRSDGDVIGESDVLNGSNEDVTIQLEDPIEATSAGTLTESITAVLVDETGTPFQQPASGEVDVGFQQIDDDATVTIEVNELAANVELPDQALGTTSGGESAAVQVQDVTGEAGQFVVVTPADDASTILGSTELDQDVAGADVTVRLDQPASGELRVHLTTDTGLLGGDALVTDAGTVFGEASVDITEQAFEGSTDQLTVDSSTLQAGGAAQYRIVVHDQTGVEAGEVGPPIGSSATLSGDESDISIGLNTAITSTQDVLVMLHFPDGGSAIPVLNDGAFGIGDAQAGTVTDTATVTIQEAANGSVTFNDQALGTNADGSPAVLVENVQPVDLQLVTEQDAFDPQDDFLVLTNGTSVNGADEVLDAVQLSEIPDDGDVVLNASGATPGQHTVVLYEPNAEGTGPDLDAPRRDQTGAKINASATVFDGSVSVDDQQSVGPTDELDVTSDLQPTTASDYVIVVHDQTDVEAGGVGPLIGTSGNLTGTFDGTITLNENITSTQDVLVMLHFPSAEGPAGSPIPTVSENGDISFGIGDDQAGTVTDTATVTIRRADSLTVTTQPADTQTASTPLVGNNSDTIAVEVTDTTGATIAGVDVTVEAANGSGSITAGTTTVTTNASGIAAFDDLEIETADDYELVFSINGSDAEVATDATARSDTFTVEFGDPATLTGDGVTVTANDTADSQSITVSVQDAFGNPISGESVNVTDADGLTGLAAGDTVTTGPDGEATLSFNETTAGSFDVSLELTSNTSITETVPVTVEAAEASSLSIDSFIEGDTIEAGEVLNIVVNATDEFGNPAVNQTLDNVTVTAEADGEVSSIGGLELNATGQTVPTVGDDEITTAREQSITVNADGVSAASQNLTVEPAAAAQLNVVSAPDSIEAGTAPTLTVEVADEFGNRLTGTNPDVSNFTVDSEFGGEVFSADPQRFTGGTAEVTTDALTEADSAHTLNVTGDGLDTGSTAIEVTPAAPASLDGEDVTVANDASDQQFVVSVTDQFGNGIQGETVVIDTSSPTLSGLPLSVDTDAAGDAVFGFNETTPDDYTIDLSVEGRSLTTTVNVTVVGDADSVEVITQPSDVEAGETFTVEAASTDSNGNRVPNTNVSISVNSGDGTLIGTTTVETNDDGVATFDDLEIEAADSYNLTVSIDGGDTNVASSANATTNDFTVSPADATSVEVIAEPAGTQTAGDALRPPNGDDLSVIVEDRFGNRVSDVDVTVSADGNLTAGSTTTVSTDATGFARFGNLVIEQAGSYDLEFSIDAGDSGVAENDTAVSNDFTVEAAAGNSITAADVTLVAGASDQTFTATVTDQFGNPVEGARVLIDSSETSPTPAGLNLSRETNADGVVTFEPNENTVDDYQVGLELDSDSSVTDSLTLNVISGDPDAVDFSATPSDETATEADQNVTYTVTVTNSTGDPVENVAVEADATAGSNVTFANDAATAQKTTDSTGQVQFTVTSNEAQSDVTVTFSTVTFGDQVSDASTRTEALTFTPGHVLAQASDTESVFLAGERFDLSGGELVIDNSNLTITGAGTDNTTLVGDLNVTGDDNVLQNFTVEGNVTLAGSGNDISGINVTGTSAQPATAADGGDEVSTEQTSATSGVIFVQDSASLTDVSSTAIVIETQPEDDLTLANAAADEVAVEQSAVNESDTDGQIALFQEISENEGITAEAVEEPNNAVVSAGADGVVISVNNSAGAEAPFDSIQAAVDSAPADATIKVASGTYNESVTIDVDGLTIAGGNSVVVDGSGSGDGFSIAADNITIREVTVTNFSSGVEVTEGIRNLRLDGLTIDKSNNGLRVSTAASVEGLQVVDSTFSENDIGVYFAHPQPDDGNVTNVVFETTTFRGHSEKALYAETLSNATFDDVRVINGQDGFDINLKAGDYGDITVKNSVFDGLGSEALKFKEYDGTGGDVGGGPNYELGDVTVNNVTVTDSYAAIWAFGYIQTDLDLTVTESSFAGNEYHFLINPAAIGASDLSELVENESLGNEFARAALVDSRDDVVYSGFERAFAEDEVAKNDTVTVFSGTYNESVTVDVDGVTLEGPNAGIPGDSDQRGDEAVLNGTIDLAAADVEVNGLVIEGESGQLVNAGGEGYELTNSVVNAGADAVAVYSKADGGLLANNTFVAAGASNYAVRLGDAANVTVRDNRFDQAAVPDNSSNTPQGILLSSTENAEVRGNVFEGVDSGQAILVTNNPGNTSSVTIAENDITGFDSGVVLFEDAYEIKTVSISGNTISDTNSTGIVAVDTSGNDGFSSINGESSAEAQADALFADNTVDTVSVDDVTVSEGSNTTAALTAPTRVVAL